jgi:helicase
MVLRPPLAGMKLDDLFGRIPEKLLAVLRAEGITDLRPSQAKALDAGLLDGKSVLVCTPTASGKTLIAELAALRAILDGDGKAVYIVPLIALASEKYREFQRKYGRLCKVALSIGDRDSADPYLAEYDLIICTAEKLDSLIRHQAPWLRNLAVVITDEVHLLNDPSRGPTLEILLTLLRRVAPNAQMVALSATIGNPKELAEWLHAVPVQDDWRPVPLKKGIYCEGKVEFEDALAR